MEKNKLLDVGDIFVVKPSDFEFYSATVDKRILSEYPDEDLLAKFGLFSVSLLYEAYDELGSNAADMLLILKYLGDGKVKEMSTGKIFPIYVDGADFKILDGIYAKPQGDITTRALENVKNIELAEKLVKDASEYKLAYVVDPFSVVDTNIENYLSKFSKYNNEQRKLLLDVLERCAVKRWEKEGPDFINLLDEQKSKNGRSNN